MATSKFKGPVNSVNGFYFHPALWTAARPMTITCTSIILAIAASGVGNSLVLNASVGGLSYVNRAWANIRNVAGASIAYISCRPYANGTQVFIRRVQNTGTGQKWDGGGATVDLFMQGYVS